MAQFATGSEAEPPPAPLDEEVDAEAITEALHAVREKVQSVAAARAVKLIAVSKLKPPAAVIAAHKAGQVYFGENYAQELMEKAGLVPDTVRWHFIGKLQSNKARKLVTSVPNLVAIETVDSASLADKLAAAAAEVGYGAAGKAPLDAYVQVDTSGEETKGGVAPEDAADLCSHIARNCGPGLRLAGLMTIGAPGDMSAFDRLRSTRDAVASTIGVASDDLGLSMGMSDDYEEAIIRGSTSVRVGSLIFGARPKKGP